MHIHGAHGLFVVGYNDELAVLTKLFDHLLPSLVYRGNGQLFRIRRCCVS